MENQSTVNAWQRETFGRPEPLTALRRLYQELQELEYEIRHGKTNRYAKKISDAQVVLWQLADACGVTDVNAAVQPVMAENRKRKWRLHGDGTAQHIEPGN